MARTPVPPWNASYLQLRAGGGGGEEPSELPTLPMLAWRRRGRNPWTRWRRTLPWRWLGWQGVGAPWRLPPAIWLGKLELLRRFLLFFLLCNSLSKASPWSTQLDFSNALSKAPCGNSSVELERGILRSPTEDSKLTLSFIFPSTALQRLSKESTQMVEAGLTTSRWNHTSEDLATQNHQSIQGSLPAKSSQWPPNPWSQWRKSPHQFSSCRRISSPYISDGTGKNKMTDNLLFLSVVAASTTNPRVRQQLKYFLQPYSRGQK